MMSTVRASTRVAIAAAVVGGALMLGSAPALADTTIWINPGNVPTTAADFGTHSCDLVPGGTSSTTDGWVFVLPANKGAFTSLTLSFEVPGDGTVVVHVPADGGTILQGNGTSKAVYSSPAGYRLVNASATITGTSNGFFVLTHTCPAAASPTPKPSPSSSSSSPAPQPSGSSSSLAAFARRSADHPGLLIGGFGLGLIAVWVALSVARRRRDAEG
jgi:hypothetical protein